MKRNELQEMQRRLSQVEGSYYRLLNHLPGVAYRCVVRNGHSYMLDFVSSRSERLLGLPPDELVFMHSNVIEQMTFPEDLQQVRDAILECVRTQRGYELYYRVRLKNGEVKWIWDQGEGIFDADGVCVNIEGILMDVTEQKNHEIALAEENLKLRSSIKNSYGLGKMVGKSDAMQKSYELMLKAAKCDSNVMIYGDTGVGKDLAAQTIHELSGVSGRYVPVNCGAIPEQLLESQFFGHVKGAFSGATSNQQGFLGAAHDGTLFLDEVGELPLNLQVKLLRALETKSYTPVGSNEVRRSNFRLISATNRDLQKMVASGVMRADFFYRIHVLTVRLPSLSERHGDIPLLIDAYAREKGIDTPLPMSVRMAMEQYNWPGNVRELQNALERFWAFGETGLDVGGPGDGFVCMPRGLVPDGVLAAEAPTQPVMALSDARENTEKQRIIAALEANRWKKGDTAVALGVTTRTLQRKLKKYGIKR